MTATCNVIARTQSEAKRAKQSRKNKNTRLLRRLAMTEGESQSVERNVKALTKEEQAKLTPAAVIEILKKGNQEFLLAISLRC